MLNEQEHIERVISGFLETGYPNLSEILVADGGSKDKTREIVLSLNKKDPRIKLIDNPDKYQSFGLNKMIQLAQGEVFLRADGHCFYSEDYIEKCIEKLLETDAKNVGGAQRYKAVNFVQAGTALAVKSFLGNGGAKYMNESYNGYADTVFLGCFWTNILREIGGFNTENITNQDSELNLRLIEKFGECVYISSEIKSYYFPRGSFYKLFKQYFRYGRGRFLTRILHPNSSPIRGVTPFLFILIIGLYIIVDLLTPISLFSLELVGFLIAITIVESSRLSFIKRIIFSKEIWEGEGKTPGIISNIFGTFISLLIMQVAHFSGFLYQLGRSILKRSKKW